MTSAADVKSRAAGAQGVLDHRCGGRAGAVAAGRGGQEDPPEGLGRRPRILKGFAGGLHGWQE